MEQNNIYFINLSLKFNIKKKLNYKTNCIKINKKYILLNKK